MFKEKVSFKCRKSYMIVKTHFYPCSNFCISFVLKILKDNTLRFLFISMEDSMEDMFGVEADLLDS